MTWCAGPRWDGVARGFPFPPSRDLSSFLSPPAPWPSSKPPSRDVARLPGALLARRSRGCCADPGEQGLHPKRPADVARPPPPPPRSGKDRGRQARATLSESLPQRHLGEGAGGRGRRRGRRAGRRRDAPQARLPGCLSHIPPDSVTCGIAPPPRALPRLPPSFQTRHHCPRPSKPQESKFPSLNLHLRRTMVRFPSAPPPPRHLDPSTPGPGDWEGPSRARVPRRGRAGSRAAWRPYLPRVVAPAAPGLRFPR